MSLAKKLIRGGIWVGIASLITALIGYAFRYALILNLSVVDYGLFYAILSVFLFATTFIDLGLGTSLLKFVGEAMYRPRRIRSLILYSLKIKSISGSIYTILVLFLAKPLAEHYFVDTRASVLFISLGLIYLFIDTLFNLPFVLLQSAQDQELHALGDVLRHVLQIGIVIWLLSLGMGLWAPVIAIGVSAAVQGLVWLPIVLTKHYRTIFSVKAEKNFRLHKQVRNFAFANLLFLSGTYVLAYTDTYMLTYFSGLEAVGLYNAAVPTARMVLFFSTAFTLILIPLVAQLHKQRKTRTLHELVRTIHRISLLLLVPVALVLIAYPTFVLDFLFGTVYIPVARALQILAASSLFSMVFLVNSHIINGLGKPEHNSRIIFQGAVLNIILNLILIPLFSITGAAMATLSGYIFMSIKTTYVVHKDIPHINEQYGKTIAKIALSGAAFLLVANTLRNVFSFDAAWISAVVVLIISGLSYVLISFMLRAVTLAEVKRILQLISTRDN